MTVDTLILDPAAHTDLRAQPFDGDAEEGWRWRCPTEQLRLVSGGSVAG